MSIINIRAAILQVAASWFPPKVVALISALLDLALTDAPLNMGVAPDALKVPLLRLIRSAIGAMPNPIARRVLTVLFDRLGENLIDAAWDSLFPPEGGPRMGACPCPPFGDDVTAALAECGSCPGLLLAT